MFARTAIRVLEDFVKNGGIIGYEISDLDSKVYVAEPKVQIGNFTYFGTTLKDLAVNIKKDRRKVCR